MAAWLYHLDLPPPPEGVIVPGKVTNENTEINVADYPMLPKTRQLLERFYAPYNAMLADLLGDPGFNYEYAGV